MIYFTFHFTKLTICLIFSLISTLLSDDWHLNNRWLLCDSEKFINLSPSSSDPYIQYKYFQIKYVKYEKCQSSLRVIKGCLSYCSWKKQKAEKCRDHSRKMHPAAESGQIWSSETSDGIYNSTSPKFSTQTVPSVFVIGWDLCCEQHPPG